MDLLTRADINSLLLGVLGFFVLRYVKGIDEGIKEIREAVKEQFADVGRDVDGLWERSHELSNVVQGLVSEVKAYKLILQERAAHARKRGDSEAD